MKDRAYRHLPIATLFLTLLLVLPVLAAADEDPRATRRGDPGAAVLARTSCPACELAQKRCTVGCFGVGDKSTMAACLMGCDNAAATCSCEGKATLNSEDLIPRPDLFGEKALACHSTTPCGTEYASCATWSGFYDCGDPYCGFYRWCGDCDSDFGCFGPALRQHREQYRVCFNSQGQSCTEYQGAITFLACGC